MCSVVHSLYSCCLGPSVWMNPGFSVGVSQNPKLHVKQISAINSKSSTAVSNQGAHSHNVSSSQIPTVNFDLGNEWDDWDDFDDENLVHASETSLTSCAPNAKPQVHQSVEYNMPGTLNCWFHYTQEIHVENQCVDC